MLSSSLRLRRAGREGVRFNIAISGGEIKGQGKKEKGKKCKHSLCKRRASGTILE
jgi:hypothetical protein